VRVLRIILLVIVGFIVGVAVVATLGSVTYNLATSDPNVPVQKLWHGKFVRTDGYLTAYREWGTGAQQQQIVLIGGFLEPTFVWDQVAPLLARGFHVYALDLDGFGYTQRHGPWTLAHWGDQVQAFMRAEGIKRPIVVGHSLGAAVAVELARRHLASGIVLVDGDALRTGGPPQIVRTALVHSPFFTTIYRFLLRSPWAVKRLLHQAYGTYHPALDNLEVKRWTNPFRAAGARQALQGIAKNGIAGFTRPQLRKVVVPALVVWGANDKVDSISAGRATAQDLHARFVSVPRAGHLSMFTSPQRLNGAIVQMFGPVGG
jgi:pimeloyl-ACP methyl ester carboxylesterase